MGLYRGNGRGSGHYYSIEVQGLASGAGFELLTLP